MTREEMIDILERALAVAGGDEADAIVSRSRRNVSRFANSTLNQNMTETTAELTLRVIVDGREGIVSTTGLDDDELKRVAALARELAARSEPIEGFTGLWSGTAKTPDVPSSRTETETCSPQSKGEALAALFEEGRGRNVEFAGSWSTSHGSIAVGNSHGVRRFAPISSDDAVMIALAGRQSGFSTRLSRSTADIDVVSLGREAIDRATLARSEPDEIEPGRYDVILEPPALAEIFEWMNMITFSGRAFEDESSFFVGNVGKQILSPAFTLVDDPTDPEFLPFPFDMEGLPTRRTPIIENGTIRGPVVDTLMASRLGVEPTANSAGPGSDEHGVAMHLSMSGGDATTDDLVASTERGIWITRFHYLNGLLEPKSALMTGMTRDGTFLIENGRVTKRLVNLRWTQSMVEAFASLDGLTRERRIVPTWWNRLGGTIAPTARIRGWNFTGVQK